MSLCHYPAPQSVSCTAGAKNKVRKEKGSASDGGFVRRRCTARIITSDDSASDEPIRDDNVADSFDVSDSELADIDLDFVANSALAANSSTAQ